jgi:putative membrane protein
MTSASGSSRPGAEHRRYLLLLGVLFGVIWIVLAITPRYRADWALENVLVVVFAAFVALTYERLTLSRISYTLIFLFLCLHEVGAHYTYAETPYDEWFKALTGRTLNSLLGWERNNFDRVVHFSYGLLLAYPVREIFLRVAAVRGFWGYFLPLDLTMSTSMMFELFEWVAAELFGGELGQAYLGTQGDVWDAHKDMALASLGALIAMLVTYAINRALQRDFAAEWAESLRVKMAHPLGEDAIARMLEDRGPGRRA